MTDRNELAVTQPTTVHTPAPASVKYVSADNFGEHTQIVQIEVVQGPERVRDSAEMRAKPVNPAQVPLVYVRRSHLGIDLGKIHSGEVDDRARYEKNRKILRRLRSLMMRQSKLTWLGDGDSITQLGTSTENYWYMPNGPARDRFADVYIFGSVDEDIRTAIPQYTSMEMFGVDDGQERVHTKKGLNWEAIEACEMTYGCSISYLNMAIGSTNSGDAGGFGGVRPNGTQADRLAAKRCAASKIDVAVFNYGMNSPGRSTTAEEHVLMAEDLRSAHPDVTLIFVGQAKPNDIYRAGDD